MTGVLALAAGLGPTDLTPYWPYAVAFVSGIGLLALGLIAGRRLFGGAPSHGYVLDINAVRAQGGAAAPQQKRAA